MCAFYVVKQIIDMGAVIPLVFNINSSMLGRQRALVMAFRPVSMNM